MAKRDVVIPKRHTVFRFEIPQPEAKDDEADMAAEDPNIDHQSQPRVLEFELHGSLFEHRPAERATKKFKPRNLPDL